MIHGRMIVFAIPFVVFCFLTTSVFLLAEATPETGGNISSTTENRTVSISPFVSNATERVQVVASFYPVFEFVKKVGGDRVEVSSLIPVGTEPHDFDPTVKFCDRYK